MNYSGNESSVILRGLQFIIDQAGVDEGRQRTGPGGIHENLVCLSVELSRNFGILSKERNLVSK